MKKSKLFIAIMMLTMFVSQTMFSYALPNSGGYASEFKYCEATTVFAGDECYVRMPTKINNVLEDADDIDVSSSDKNVVKSGDYDGELYFKTKSPGVTTLTVTAKTDSDVKTYTMVLTVVPYENPYTSIKIGNKQVKSLFNKTAFKKYKLSKGGKKKISVEAGEGWTVKRIRYERYNYNGKMSGFKSKSVKKASGKFNLKATSKKYQQLLDITITNPNYYNGSKLVYTINMSKRKGIYVW